MKVLTAFAFLFVSLTSCSQKVKETFLIPLGFEGRINVIFNQPKTAPVPVENGRRIYRIPADGILITSSKLETGFLNQEYYYVSKSGRKIKIPVRDLHTADVPVKPTVVYYGVTGVYGNSTDTNPLDYIESIIASKGTSDSIYTEASRTAFNEIIKFKTSRQF